MGLQNVIGRIGRSNQKGHQTWLQDHSGTKNGYSSLRTSQAPVLEIGGPSFVLKTCYAIIKTRRYGLETKISLVMDDSGSQYLSFASREEARAWIRRLVEGPTNYLERNESTPLIYAITKLGSRSFRDAYKRTRGCAGQP